MKPKLGVAIALALRMAGSISSAQPRIEQGRYIAPHGEFSIRYDSVFKPEHEWSDTTTALVDFLYNTTLPEPSWATTGGDRFNG